MKKNNFLIKKFSKILENPEQFGSFDEAMKFVNEIFTELSQSYKEGSNADQSDIQNMVKEFETYVGEEMTKAAAEKGVTKEEMEKEAFEMLGLSTEEMETLENVKKNLTNKERKSKKIKKFGSTIKI